MIELAIGVGALILFYFTGKVAETNHYKRIKERESRLINQPVLNSRTVEPGAEVQATTLAIGSVVISIDHFKRFLSSLRLFVGGELKSFSPLIDRARREAILRMKESCPNADLFINMRFETSSISQGAQKTLGTVEVLAYATAVILKKDENRT